MSDLSRYKKTLESLEFLVNFLTQNHRALNHLPGWLWNKSQGGIDFEQFKQVIDDAKAEIKDFEARALALTGAPAPIDENDILIHSALRFQGYRYQQEVRLDSKPIIEAYKRGERYPEATGLDLLATFFLLQRFLYKWGGETLPKTSPHWRAFRQLFLETCSVEVPERYRAGAYEARWLYDIFPRIDSYRAIIEQIHTQTNYQNADSSSI
ncbi:MAG: hypothetical protein MUF49_26310 [Oculatellaceae cyanobacterium Prado106]|nr:hypothetical protein [Oculatellaceae cyanobacterium Prado106]